MRLGKGKEELRTQNTGRTENIVWKRASCSKEESNKEDGATDRKIRFINEESS